MTPVEDGQAEVGWEEGHEVLARDFEQWTTLLEGPGGEIDQATHDAFMDVAVDPLTSELAPSLWVDGADHSGPWTECLSSSGYTNPTGVSADPGELLRGAQRQADAANEWIACAREHGLESLADVTADADIGGIGAHVEIPLTTDPVLLQTVVEACPTFSEEYLGRVMDGDPTLDEDLEAGRLSAGPLIMAEQPPGSGEEGYDIKATEDGKRYLEFNRILYAGEKAFIERHTAEKNGTTTPEDSEPTEN
jgi:hypothetical protein